MKKINPQKSFLPQCDGRALDFIKISAAFFMVIDHVDNILLHHQQLLMNLLGRGTFPLFCYAVVVAILKVKASDKKEKEQKEAVGRYFVRLGIFALIAQPVYAWAVDPATGNVIFTLAFGAIVAAFSMRASLWQMYVLYTLSLISMLWTVPIEFGPAGVMLPSALLLVWKGEKRVWPFLLLLLFFINLGGLGEILHGNLPPAGWLLILLNGVFAAVLPWLVLDMARNMKQTGRLLPKYALHIFYPGHLLLLKLIGMAFFP